MTIDTKIMTIEVKDEKSFQEMQDEAYKRFVDETGFKGDIYDMKKRAKYFSNFNMVPIIEDNRPVGVKILYQLADKKPNKRFTRSASGSGPAKYIHFK